MKKMHINSNNNEKLKAKIRHLLNIFLHHVKHIKLNHNVLNAKDGKEMGR